MRRLLLATLLMGAAPISDEQRRLLAAKRDAAAASIRADALTAAAARERDSARRARTAEAALAERVSAAAARLTAAEARATLIARAQVAAQARLATAQAPAAQLLGALAALARRPPIATVAQPGSVSDLVHIRAVFGTQLPAIRARAAGLRDGLAEVRRLRASAALATSALRDSRGTLERERVGLATLAARHRRQAAALNDRALEESDLAVAMGERSRDLVDRMAEQDEEQVAIGGLSALVGPLPRPLAPGTTPPALPRAGYRLPVAGQLVTGFGEVSRSGVRARGLTFRVPPAAPVVAPAAGIVRFARPFRGYRTILVIDHGAGWTSLLTGLDRAAVRVGQSVAAGATVGQASRGEDPEITVELRRRGRPADIVGLIG